MYNVVRYKIEFPNLFPVFMVTRNGRLVVSEYRRGHSTTLFMRELVDWSGRLSPWKIMRGKFSWSLLHFELLSRLYNSIIDAYKYMIHKKLWIVKGLSKVSNVTCRGIDQMFQAFYFFCQNNIYIQITHDVIFLIVITFSTLHVVFFVFS